MEEEILKQLRELKRDVDILKAKRVTQVDVVPDAIKQRHIGEGVRFVRYGLDASRPTTGEIKGAVYYATDVNKLYIWDGSAWQTH